MKRTPTKQPTLGLDTPVDRGGFPIRPLGKAEPQCKACNHGRRKELDHFLATGGNQHDAARKFGLSQACLSRHLNRHTVPAAAAVAILAAGQAYESEVQSATARAILGRLAHADRALVGAEEDRDWGAMVRAITEVRKIHMDVARLTGELKPETEVQVNLVTHPDWLELEARFTRLREACPEYGPGLAYLAGLGELPVAIPTRHEAGPSGGGASADRGDDHRRAAGEGGGRGGEEKLRFLRPDP